MQEIWDRITARLAELDRLTEIRLLPGATSSELASLGRHLGVKLPLELDSFFRIHNGQNGGIGLVFGHTLLPVEQIRKQWDSWRDIDEQEMNRDSAVFMKSSPDGFIKPLYSNNLWIPITHDWSGNHFGLDFDPDFKGQEGQVIMFGADQDTKQLVAHDFPTFVDKFVTHLESAEWQEDSFQLL